MRKSRLTFRERFFFLFGISLTGFFSAPFFLSKEPVRSFEERSPLLDSKIRIRVSGAVARPGVYEEPPGVSVKNILHKAGVLPSADKSSVYDKKTLFSSCDLLVPEKASKKRGAKK